MAGSAIVKPSTMAPCRFSMILLLLLAGVFIFGVEQAEAAGKPVTTARKEDIPFIKCSVCEAISKHLIRQVNRKRDKIAPKKITELHIIDITENICNMKKEESDWILKLDIVENGDKLQLVEQPVEGVCKTDCKTIERACQEVMGEHDTDVAEYLFKAGANRAGLLKLLCKDLSEACVGQPPRLPKDRGSGETFTPKVGKQAEMDKLMRTLNNDAPGLKVYSKEDIQNNPGIAYSGGRSPRDPDYDDDEDYDEDEGDVDEGQVKPGVKTWGDSFAKLGDSVAKLGAKVGAHTQKVIQNASKRVNKARRRIHRWWSGKKPAAKPSSPSRSKRKSSSDVSSEEL